MTLEYINITIYVFCDWFWPCLDCHYCCLLFACVPSFMPLFFLKKLLSWTRGLFHCLKVLMCRDIIWYRCGTGRWFRVCVTDTHCARSWPSIECLCTNIFRNCEWEVLVVLMVMMCNVLTAHMFCAFFRSSISSTRKLFLSPSLFVFVFLSQFLFLFACLCLFVSLWLSNCLPLSLSVWLSVALDCLLGLSPSACLSVSVMNAIVALDCLSTWSVSISLSVLFLCRSGCLWLWTVCLLGLSPSACLFVSLSVWLSVVLDCVSLVCLCLSVAVSIRLVQRLSVAVDCLSTWSVSISLSVLFLCRSGCLWLWTVCLSWSVFIFLSVYWCSQHVCILHLSLSAHLHLSLSACLRQAVCTVFLQCLTSSVNLLVMCQSCSLSLFLFLFQY